MSYIVQYSKALLAYIHAVYTSGRYIGVTTSTIQVDCYYMQVLLSNSLTPNPSPSLSRMQKRSLPNTHSIMEYLLCLGRLM